MPIDTTKTISSKDSINSTKSFIAKTTIIELKNKDKLDYLSKSLDFISSIAWPIVVLIIIISFKKNIVELFSSLISKLNASDNIHFSKNGVSFSSSKIKLDKTIATQSEVLPSMSDFNDMSIKILSTLWNEQLNFDASFNNRWTFMLGTNHSHYSDFTQASKNLRILGLVTTSLENGQIFLTNIGIKFCDKNRNELGYYSFFRSHNDT